MGESQVTRHALGCANRRWRLQHRLTLVPVYAVLVFPDHLQS